MQFLSISHYPAHGFIYTSAGSEASSTSNQTNTTVPIPAPGPGAAGAPAVGAAGLTASATSPGQGSVTPGTTTPQAGADRSAIPMVMTTVPLPSYSTLFQHFVYACQPFWCHRHTVTVPGGVVYEIGDFRVRIGDVRQTQPTARVRGTAVEIEWRGPSLVASILANSSSRPSKVGLENKSGDTDSGIEMSASDISDSDIDAEYAATAGLIREFWARLGVEGAREAILVPDVGKEVKERLGRWKKQEAQRTDDDGREKQEADSDPDPEAGVDEARQFMEIFRFNR